MAEFSWTTDDYESARQSPYSQYVADPVVEFKDAFLGIPTDSWYKKLADYVNKVRELEYNAQMKQNELNFNEQQRIAARDESWAREDSAYQRLVEDMKKAGLNPYWMLSNGTGSPSTSTSQQISYGSSMTRGEFGYESSKSKAASLLKTLGVLVAFLKFMS